MNELLEKIVNQIEQEIKQTYYHESEDWCRVPCDEDYFLGLDRAVQIINEVTGNNFKIDW